MNVFDLHCDTATELLDRYLNPISRLRSRPGHIDLTRGKRLPGYAQMFAFYTSAWMRLCDPHSPREIFDASLQNFRRELAENSDWIAQAKTAEEIQSVTREGKIAAVFSLEGTAGIGYDPGRLEQLAAEGFRMVTLTWNDDNPLAGSHKTGGGLTAQGREFVRQAQRHHMALDVSHLSEQAFWELVDMTQGPVSASHSNARALCGHSRNLTDEQFRAICQTGGVAGLNLYTEFLGDGPVTLETVCRHVLHWLELGGEHHIALGGDLDGCEALPEGFTGVDDYPKLAQCLLHCGVKQETIADIFWNNAMRLIQQCSM